MKARFGQTVTEYLLIVGAIAILVLGVYQTFGKDVVSYVTHVETSLFGAWQNGGNQGEQRAH